MITKKENGETNSLFQELIPPKPNLAFGLGPFDLCRKFLLEAKENIAEARVHSPEGRVFYNIAEAQIIIDNTLLLLERIAVKDKLQLMRIKHITNTDEC